MSDMAFVSKISRSKKETEEIARGFLRRVLFSRIRKRAIVVGLSGELSAGKTAFVQAVGKLLRIKRKMPSPTFVIIRRYPLQGEPIENLFHLDAYRLKSGQELLYLGWREIIKNPKNLVLLEWPERVAKVMPKSHHQIEISHIEKGRRGFKIKYV